MFGIGSGLTVTISGADHQPTARLITAAASTTVGATLTINNCTVSGNSALGVGGGICNDGQSEVAPAVLTINNSTLSGNSAIHGGGIFNSGFDFGSATLTINNSTVSGNSASLNGGIGCGIYEPSEPSKGVLGATRADLSSYITSFTHWHLQPGAGAIHLHGERASSNNVVATQRLQTVARLTQRRHFRLTTSELGAEQYTSLDAPAIWQRTLSPTGSLDGPIPSGPVTMLLHRIRMLGPLRPTATRLTHGCGRRPAIDNGNYYSHGDGYTAAQGLPAPSIILQLLMRPAATAPTLVHSRCSRAIRHPRDSSAGGQGMEMPTTSLAATTALCKAL